MLIYFCWFVGGAVAHKTLSFVFALGTAANLLNQVLNASLLVLKNIDQQKIIAINENYKKLEKELSPEEAEKIKFKNLQSHFLWREMTIGLILAHCPDSFRLAVKFNDWPSAMALLKNSRR